MPLTQMDPVAALVVIDLQKGIVALPLAHSAGEIVGRAAQLARAFRARGFPVVWVTVTGRAPGRTDRDAPHFTLPPGWADLVPELGAQPGDLRVTKQRVGAFIGTPLDDLLRQRGVTQLVVAGIATGSGVEATARSAHDHGYNVVLVADAMADREADTHRFMVEVIFRKIGQTTLTDDVLETSRVTRPVRFSGWVAPSNIFPKPMSKSAPSVRLM